MKKPLNMGKGTSITDLGDIARSVGWQYGQGLTADQLVKFCGIVAEQMKALQRMGDVGNREYNPRLNEACFMDLACQLVKVASMSDVAALLEQRPLKQREAAIQLQLAAERYIEVVESLT